MEEQKENKTKTIAEVIDHGPLKVTGNFILKDLQRDLETTPCEILLCRCGRSDSKPYCDKSHKR
jgi:CDGSH-type Zn-finger protein